MDENQSNRRRVAIAVLAAGESKRMGQAKLLLPWGESTILAQTLDHVTASSADRIILVTGAYRNEVSEIADSRGILHLHNPVFKKGEILSSLQTAVHYLISNAPVDGVLVMLGDLPFIPTRIVEMVIGKFRSEGGTIIAPVHEGRRGHPVLIAASLFPELLDMPFGLQPRDLLRCHADEIVELPVDTGVILRDIDTPEEYERWRGEANSEG